MAVFACDGTGRKVVAEVTVGSHTVRAVRDSKRVGRSSVDVVRGCGDNSFVIVETWIELDGDSRKLLCGDEARITLSLSPDPRRAAARCDAGAWAVYERENDGLTETRTEHNGDAFDWDAWRVERVRLITDG
jgi:hypothetical protein